MSSSRKGQRKLRKDIEQRDLSLGNYLIVTDTKETEKNYFSGLKRKIPEDLKKHIMIEVNNTETKNLVDTALGHISNDAQYRKAWIVFDRDKVVGFDKIIEDAYKKSIEVGWSNPCIEVFFSAYFGKMISVADSTVCCSKFRKAYHNKTGQEYDKADTKIYEKVVRFGNEIEALRIVKNRHEQHVRDHKCVPSEMIPNSTLYQLVTEINQKIVTPNDD